MLKNFPNLKFKDRNNVSYIMREILPSEDYVNFFNYMSNPKVSNFIYKSDLPKSLAEAEKELEYWRSLFRYGRSIFWAIATSDHKMIGTIGFNYMSLAHKRAELSYDLDPDFWSRGIMTSALKEACKFVREEVKINRIQSIILTDNYPSIKIMDKLGFKKEAIMKNYSVLRGEFRDSFLYSQFQNEI